MSPAWRTLPDALVWMDVFGPRIANALAAALTASAPGSEAAWRPAMLALLNGPRRRGGADAFTADFKLEHYRTLNVPTCAYDLRARGAARVLEALALAPGAVAHGVVGMDLIEWCAGSADPVVRSAGLRLTPWVTADAACCDDALPAPRATPDAADPAPAVVPREPALAAGPRR